MPLTVEQFTERLTASGVLSALQLRDVVAALPTESPARSNGEELARELVRQKRLTKFQVEQIYAGKGTSLTLGNYVILDKLGQGGMGMVLKAMHRRMERIVALKVMSAGGMQSPDAVQRFHREVKAAAKLTHPNIVTAFDADEAKGTHFLVMEYVEGTDLSALVKKRGPLPVEQAVQCIIQAARGLEFAHEQGVIHRDIKPANLLIDGKGTVKILDMGLARIEDSVGGSSEGAGLTSTGTIMGTVDYMSPEQAMDTKQADARSDIYSLGCSLYYLLTGRSLFDGDTIMKKLIGHREGAIPDLEISLVAPRQESRTSVDAGSSSASSGVDGASAFVSRSDTATLKALNSVFRRMVAKKPNERQQSMTEVIADLERCLSGGSATLAIERSSNNATNVSVGSTGETTNDLKDFLRQIAGSESPTVSAVQGSGTAVSASSVDAPTMISSSSDAQTNPGTEKTQLFDQGSHPIATKARAVPSQPSNSRMKLLIGSVATIAVVLLAVIFAMKAEPKKDREQEIASTPNRETGVAPARANTPTVYEILTSDEYEWTPPENLGPGVNTPTAESFPALSGDGLRLVFHSFGRANANLSEATRTRIDQPFGNAQPLGEEFGNRTGVFGAALSGDGLLLVFGSGRPGGPGEPGNPNLWQSTRPDLATPFSQPICLKAISHEGDDSNPWLSSDGLTIYFQSHRPGQGTYWMSRRASREADFAPPTPFELPLLPGTDGYSHMDGFGLSSDERVLLFAPFYQLEGRDRMNLLKFVRSTRDAKFDTPVNLDPILNGEHVNGRPTLSADGTVLIFQSERPGGIGGQDLWMSRRVRKTKVNAPSNIAPKPAVTPFDAAQALAHQEAWSKHLGIEIESTNSVGQKMVLIPPGEFLMGSSDEQVAAALKAADAMRADRGVISRIETSERPQHRVVISKPLRMSATEVTVGQFKRFVEASKYVTEAERYGFGDSAGMAPNNKVTETQRQSNWRSPGYAVDDNSPVAQITWNDAVAYCKWLSGQEQITYRLPTEAEWEYACRAGSTSQYSFGDDYKELPKYGWPIEGTVIESHAVGKLLPNNFGLFDMHGNLYEWCHDYFDANWYGSSPTNDPAGPASGSNRVLRGGSIHNGPSQCRSASRYSNSPSSRFKDYGFRCVAELQLPAVVTATTRSFASDEWIDVMPLLNPDLDKVDIGRSLVGKNDWRIEDGELRYYGDDKSGKLYFPIRCLGRSLEWEFEFTRTAGNISFNTDIPIPGGFVPLTIGNDKIGFVNESLTDNFQVVNGQRTKLRLRVTQVGADDRLEVFVNDKPIVDWRGPLTQHKIEPPRTDPRNPSEHLSLFAHGPTNYSFRAIRMRMLNGGSAESLRLTAANTKLWIDWLGPKLQRGDFNVNSDGWIRDGEAVTTRRDISGIQVLPDTTRDAAMRVKYLLRDSKGVQINARDHKTGSTDETRELYVLEDHGTELRIVLMKAGAYKAIATQAIPASIPKDAARTLEFRVVGNTLSATLNGSLVATAKDSTIPVGDFALVALKGVLIQKVEYQSLDEPK